MEKSRFTPLDVGMVLAAVIAVVGVVLVAWRGKEAEKVELEAECVFVVGEVEQAWLDRYGEPTAAGDAVRSENGTVILGEVTSVERAEHMRATVKDGEAVWETHPWKADLIIKVRMTLTDRGADGLRAGDLRMAAGSVGRYRFGGYLATAELIAVEVKG